MQVTWKHRATSLPCFEFLSYHILHEQTMWNTEYLSNMLPVRKKKYKLWTEHNQWRSLLENWREWKHISYYECTLYRRFVHKSSILQFDITLKSITGRFLINFSWHNVTRNFSQHGLTQSEISTLNSTLVQTVCMMSSLKRQSHSLDHCHTQPASQQPIGIKQLVNLPMFTFKPAHAAEITFTT